MATDLHEFYENIGSKIRNARIKQGYSQDVLATQLGLTRSSIVNIEKGRQRPPVHTLFEISSILKITLSEILSPPISKKEEKNLNISQVDWRKEISNKIENKVEKTVLLDFIATAQNL
jgi:transcriptional regulator with XRE-family HTH domain